MLSSLVSMELLPLQHALVACKRIEEGKGASVTSGNVPMPLMVLRKETLGAERSAGGQDGTSPDDTPHCEVAP